MFGKLETPLKNKKVVLVAEFAPSSGGTRTYFFNIVHYYVQQKVSLTILLPKQLATQEVAVLEEHSPEVSIRKLVRFNLSNRLETYPFNIINRIAEHLKVGKIIRAEQPDLVVISLGIAGKLLSLVTLPYRLIYVVHTLPQGARRLSLNKVLARRFKKNKVLLTVSQYAKQQIARCWMSENYHHNLTCIYNTIPYHLDQSLPRRAPNQMVVLTLGHVVAYKNPAVWIAVAKQVVAQHPSVVFTWAGDGELLTECRDAVKEYPNINFIGSQKEVSALLTAATLYFHPSREESHGIAVVEAMKYGIPCVVSKVGGLVESVIHEQTGLIAEADSIEDFTTYLLMLIKDEAKRAQLGEAGKNRFATLFSHRAWQDSMDQLHVQLFIK